MLETQQSQTSLEEFPRSKDRPWLSVEEKNHPGARQISDLSIAEEVDRALWKDDVLRVTDYREIDVQVRNGIVSLTGHVMGAMNRWRVENAIKNIRRVRGVRIYLVQDDQLVLEVAAAVGRIEQLYGDHFFTGVRNGVVLLNGDVTSVRVRNLAEQVAARNPNVRGVINYLRVPGIDLSKEDQRFLQPAIGEPILFSDGLSGTVERVIINPNTRRVVAMLLSTQFPSGVEADGSWLDRYNPPPIRRVVIPVKAIRYLTQSSGFLTISSTETAQAEVFDPERYFVPEKGWVPPYPYCSGEVLFSVESREVMMIHPENELDFIPLGVPEAKLAIPEGVPV